MGNTASDYNIEREVGNTASDYEIERKVSGTARTIRWLITCSELGSQQESICSVTSRAMVEF